MSDKKSVTRPIPVPTNGEVPASGAPAVQSQANPVWAQTPRASAKMPKRLPDMPPEEAVAETGPQPVLEPTQDGIWVAQASSPVLAATDAGATTTAAEATAASTSTVAASGTVATSSLGLAALGVGGAAVVVAARTTASKNGDTTAPVFTSDATATVKENSPTNTAAYTATVTDASTVKFTLTAGEPDNDAFTLDASTGELRFKASPDYETRKQYTVKITATDASGNSSQQDVTINITDQPDTSVATSGAVTLGKAVAGLVVQAYDQNDQAIEGAKATTDAQGHYTLQIGAQYTGQKITLKVTDPNPGDGSGYVDEATGESRDITTALRASLVLGTSSEQQAQCTSSAMAGSSSKTASTLQFMRQRPKSTCPIPATITW